MVESISYETVQPNYAEETQAPPTRNLSSSKVPSSRIGRLFHYGGSIPSTLSFPRLIILQVSLPLSAMVLLRNYFVEPRTLEVLS